MSPFNLVSNHILVLDTEKKGELELFHQDDPLCSSNNVTIDCNYKQKVLVFLGFFKSGSFNQLEQVNMLVTNTNICETQ